MAFCCFSPYSFHLSATRKSPFVCWASQHLCNVVLTGALGAPDLCISSAADPGADRCFSTVTSTIDETVTLLKELNLFVFDRVDDTAGGRSIFERAGDTAVVFCFLFAVVDTFVNSAGCGLLAKARATALGGCAPSLQVFEVCE